MIKKKKILITEGEGFRVSKTKPLYYIVEVNSKLPCHSLV